MDGIEYQEMESMEHLAERLLKEKYQKEFTVEKIQSFYFTKRYFTAVAYPSDDPDLLFQVSVNTDGTGSADNFVSKSLMLELSDTVAQNLDDLKGIYYIYSAFLVESLKLDDPAISLNDYYKVYPQSMVNIYLHYCPDKPNDCYYAYLLKNIFKKLPPLSGNLYLYSVDENKFKEIQNYIENTDRLYDGYRKITESCFVGKLEFRDSSFSSSDTEIERMLKKRL